MQSIAPDSVKIVVTGEGVEIGGKKRPVGWEGEVSRHSARFLLAQNVARLWTTPVKVRAVEESVDDAPAVAYDAKESATEEEAVETSRVGTRFTRKRNK